MKSKRPRKDQMEKKVKRGVERGEKNGGEG